MVYVIAFSKLEIGQYFTVFLQKILKLHIDFIITVKPV